MTVRKKSQSKTRMQGKTSYRARYVELAHQGFGGFKRLLQQELLDQFDRLGKR